jgi:Protein of unknown function (DUF2800)
VRQVSASKTALLVECAWSFGQEATPGEASAAARYGTAFHSCMEEMVQSSGRGCNVVAHSESNHVAKDVDELRDHVKAAYTCLMKWLRGENPFGVTFDGRALTESSYALCVRGETARPTPGPRLEDHIYEELQAGEIGCTADLIIVPPVRKRPPLLVTDYKTAREGDFSRPAELPQLKTLALAASRALGRRGRGGDLAPVIAAVLHARRGGLPMMYGDRIEGVDLLRWCGALSRAYGRIGDGSMRPGPWCVSEFCSERDGGCPTKDSKLLDSAALVTNLLHAGSAQLPTSTESNMSPARKLGVLYALAQQAEKLAWRIREETRAAIQAGTFVETPEGQAIELRPSRRETVSKDSIIAAYGAVAGKRHIERLRKDGAVRVSEGVALHVEKAR